MTATSDQTASGSQTTTGHKDHADIETVEGLAASVTAMTQMQALNFKLMFEDQMTARARGQAAFDDIVSDTSVQRKANQANRDEMQTLKIQLMQKAVTNADVLSQQTIDHRDFAFDKHWTFSNELDSLLAADAATDVAANGEAGKSSVKSDSVRARRAAK